MATTIKTAAHTALLDPMSGIGLLVLPNPDDDVRDPLAVMGSVQRSDYAAMMRKLDALGWELLEDDTYGGPVSVDAGEHDVWSLYGREPITSAPTLEEIGKAERELLELLAS